MNIAYLILAHNNPKQFRRLLEAISTESSGIFIFIDKKSNINYFYIKAQNNIHYIIDRIPIFYSDFSQVDVILGLVRYAIQDK